MVHRPRRTESHGEPHHEPHRKPPRRSASSRDPGEPAGNARPVPDFIGRKDELSAILGAFESGPALVAIEGEAGIGKTRLIREAVASATGRSALIATCPPLPEPFTLGAVVDGIRRFRPRLGPDPELTPLAGALRPLFPDWAERLPPPLEGLDDPKERRHRILSALTELLGHLDIDVLVVEDAHWADTATLEWLLTLTASGRSDLSIVVSFRADEVASGSLLPRLTSRVPADVTLVRLALAALGLADTRELVASMFDTSEVSTEFVSFLHRHTDGIPLAVEECVLLLRDRKDIVRRDGTWIRRVLTELRVPATPRDSVLERVDRLDDGARRVLEAAAVLDAPSEEALLTVVAGLEPEAGRKGLGTALGSGLLGELAPGAYAYRHALDCLAVCAAIPASDRRHLHGRAAASLRLMRPEPVARLFRHCREAPGPLCTNSSPVTTRRVTRFSAAHAPGGNSGGDRRGRPVSRLGHGKLQPLAVALSPSRRAEMISMSVSGAGASLRWHDDILPAEVAVPLCDR
ncbi:ATP-binding protein [Streptomyces milbemycinicus]|uniref:ATP-binding protein n=1 Tax=Streptomyces milbemycinicus TaxID=476552 RepID=A0ABW8M0W3_9ACTN